MNDGNRNPPSQLGRAPFDLAAGLRAATNLGAPQFSCATLREARISLRMPSQRQLADKLSHRMEGQEPAAAVGSQVLSRGAPPA